MDLNELLIFTKVVQTGSMTAAGDALGMPKSTISRKLSELEERLGARLLHRTTRKLSLTEAGQAYFERSARIVADAEAADLLVNELQKTPRGLLRVTVPLNASVVGTSITDFLKAYPDVRVEMVSTDRVVDLVQERFDVAVRAGPLQDSTLIARRIGTVQRFLVASPSYIEERGAPASPDELGQHACLLFGSGADADGYHLIKAGRTVRVTTTPRFKVNDYEVLHSAAIAGLGIALLPETLCGADMKTGRLLRVLNDWSAPSSGIHALYPSSRHVSPAVQAFVAFLQRGLPEAAEEH